MIRAIETAASQRARGKAARREIPRAAHAEFTPVERDPVALVEAQNAGRLQDLVPLRRERMSVSPFTFYRGSAGLMAHDLAHQTVTGVHVVICGDAHLSNFGLYASPERRLVFDLNDFDEAAPGPWEWDVKRLVTSVVLGGSELGLRPKAIQAAALACATAYREAIGRVVAKLRAGGRPTRAGEGGSGAPGEGWAPGGHTNPVEDRPSQQRLRRWRSRVQSDVTRARS